MKTAMPIIKQNYIDTGKVFYIFRTFPLNATDGAVEAIACAKALQDGIIPPTINYEFPDPECDLNYTPNVSVKADLKVAISNSFGFGGHNATIVLKKI